MSNSEIEQSGTVKGHLPNEASLSGRISNGLSLSGHISIGSVASDFIIKMTVESHDDGNYYTVTSCDATIEQIDAAVAAEKRVVLFVSVDGSILELPMLQGVEGNLYYFGVFSGSKIITSFVEKTGNTSNWEFDMNQIQSEDVGYSNAALPSGITNVKMALDALVPNSHTHSNKLVLDKFAETDGKPTYDGKKISGASTAEEVEYTNAILPDASNVKSALDDTIDTQQTQSADLESLRAGVSALMDAYETQGGDIASLKTQAHTHSNKLVLDKFAETDGKPTYGGQALGGGTSDFIIRMTLASGDDGNYTIASCDTTVEQIDAAVSAEKSVVVIASDGGIIFELPMLQGAQGVMYCFGTFMNGQMLTSFVQKIDETTSEWQFSITQIEAESVNYSNAALPSVNNVRGALNALVPKSHTHANKGTLDKLSVSNGKLQYNGSDVGLKGDKGDTPVKGTDYWTPADKQEIVNDILAALPTWTGGSY